MADKEDTKATPTYKKWLVNIVLVVVVTIAMLCLAEAGMRWIDGYQLTTLELQPSISD